MPSLKAIRKRIISVKNTQKITKAMKMVAAAKLRRAQDSVTAIRPYAGKMHKVVMDLADRVAEDVLREAQEQGSDDREQWLRLDALIFGTGGTGGPEGRIRLVAVTSDRGLAGAFNSSINRRVERFLVEKKGPGTPDIDIDVLGKKGRDYLRRRNVKIAHELAGAEPKTAVERAAELTATLMEAVQAGTVDTIYIVYNEFKSAASQSVRVERLLPLKEPKTAASPGEPVEEAPRTLTDFVYEPGQKAVLTHLLPLYLETELYRILLESIASEFGARMSAMDNASRNAKEMIGRLTLQFNRARQAAITKELMEIVGGAEALKG